MIDDDIFNRFNTLVVTIFDPVVPGTNFCLELVYPELDIVQDILYILSMGCHISIPQLTGSILKSFGCLDLQIISLGNSGIDRPVSGTRCHDYAPSFRAYVIFLYIVFCSVYSLI